MALPVNGSTHLIPAYYSFYRPRKDERLSWPSWLTCSGWLTHLVVTHQLQVERRTGKVRRPETDVLPLSHATKGYSIESKRPHRWCHLPSKVENIVRTRDIPNITQWVGRCPRKFAPPP